LSAEALGVPAKVIRSADAVEQLRSSASKQQQQAQQQLLMQAGTEAAGAAGQTAGAIMGNDWQVTNDQKTGYPSGL
jgi:hypothetical protein